MAVGPKSLITVTNITPHGCFCTKAFLQVSGLFLPRTYEKSLTIHSRVTGNNKPRQYSRCFSIYCGWGFPGVEPLCLMGDEFCAWITPFPKSFLLIRWTVVRGTFSFREIARSGQASGRLMKFFPFKIVLAEHTGCKHKLPSLFTGFIAPCLSNVISRIILLTPRFDAQIPSKDDFSEIFWPDNPFWWWAQMAAYMSELITRGMISRTRSNKEKCSQNFSK